MAEEHLGFSQFVLICVSVDTLREKAFSFPPARRNGHQLQQRQPRLRLCYLSIYLAAGVKWLSDKLECNDNDRDS